LIDAALSFDEKLKFDVSKAHLGAIQDIVFHPGGQYVFTTGKDGMINQWKIESWNPLGVPDLSRVERNTASGDQTYNLLAFNSNGRLLAAAGKSNDFKVFDVPGGASGTSIPVVPGEEIFAIGYLPSDDILAAGINHFYRYRNQTGKLEEYPKMASSKSLIIQDDLGTSIFSIEGRYQDFAYELSIDSLGSEGQTGKQEINFYGTPQEVDYGPVVKAGYGRLNDTVALLVIGFASGRVMFIETEPNGDHFLPRSPEARKDFKPHQAAISDLAFSHDGKKLALASLDGTVSVWDLEDYADPSYQAVVYDRHPAQVLSIAFSPNDDYLLSGCQDGNLYFWNTRPEDYATFLCDRLRKTSNEALLQQRKLQSISRKSGLDRAYDELSSEDYRRYFGEGGSRKPVRPIRVCN